MALSPNADYTDKLVFLAETSITETVTYTNMESLLLLIYMKQRNVAQLIKLLFRKNKFDNKTMDVANLACALCNLV